MYVAATRAKENLFITYPGQVFDRASGLYLGRPCRFVDGIPNTILDRVAVQLW
jgi:DNA helicase-2/ATP-dependent DNA helicase PcrA